MLAQDYLTLRLVRLKPPGEWIIKPGGLWFVFPKGGAGKALCGPLNQQLAPGDVFVLDGAVGGRLCAPDRGEMVFASFSACFENLLPLLDSNEISLLRGITNDFKRTRLYPASSPLAMECHRLLEEVPPQFNLDHRSQLLRVAAAIFTFEFVNAQSQRLGSIRPQNHMIRVFEKLSATELISLSVAELAVKFRCCRRHLNRLFHQHFGVSVAALRMELRLSRAVSLLRNPDTKIIDVAGECGFHHLGLFNTCFKRRFGASPGQWRKKALPPEHGPSGLGGAAPNCPLRLKGLCPWTGQAQHSDAVSQPPSPTPKAVPARAATSAHALNASAEESLVAGQQKRSRGASARAFAANG
jgi:AraC-like DNA-binding protein